MQKLAEKIRRSTGCSALLNEPMSRHTTFRVGGPAELMLLPKSKDELRNAYRLLLSEDVHVSVIGNGSNLLVSDNGIKGAVIKLAGNMDRIGIKGDVITAEAGSYMKKLIFSAAAAGLSGLEMFIGIPSALGGAVRMNMGSWGSNISLVTVSVASLDKDGKELKRSRHECGFGYRTSVFASANEIVLEAELKMTKESPEKIAARQAEILRMKAASQPIAFPSAGCVFKNPDGESAGKLIEEAGLKGESVGGAVVSEAHANFIVNAGGATATDIMTLINRVRVIVLEKKGVALETEVRTIGF